MSWWPLAMREVWPEARRLRARRSVSASPLKLPLSRDTIDDYLTLVSRVASSPRGRLYVDTSFLVWMTALSSEARGEVRAWLNSSAPGRVHVPVWAVHEYFRHRAQNLHGRTLSKAVKELNGVADRTFRDLRPYLDSPTSGDIRTPEAIASAVRASLVDLKRIAVAAGRWRDEHYEANAADVIGMINDLGLTTPALMDWMEGIEAVESARYEGRVPPGFQDRGKRGRKSTNLGAAAEGDAAHDPHRNEAGSNSFGDLVFWREILDHARSVRATGVVILTNDGKNDWTMPGGSQPELDDDLRKVRSSLPPVPQPHPMLGYEARNAAGVSELALIDGTYLAILLRRSGQPSNRVFGVAVDVSVPTPQEVDATARKQARDIAMSAKSSGTEGFRAGAGRHLPVEDGSNVSDARLALRRALDASGGGPDPIMEPVIEAMTGAGAGAGALNQFLTREIFGELTTAGATWFARALGTRSIAGDPLATTYATDLLSSLDRLPPRSATAMYLGILAAAFLESPEQGSGVRTVPEAPWLTELFRSQDHPRAKPAIEAFVARLPALGGRPVYVPDAAKPPLAVTATFAPRSSRITGLQIGGIGVLANSQGDAARRLRSLLDGREAATLREVAQLACTLLGMPAEQLELSDALDREVQLGTTVGIADPADLRGDMEDLT